MADTADDLLQAFPVSLRPEAEATVRLLQDHLRPSVHSPGEKDSHLIEVSVAGEAVAIPYRLYDGDHTRIHYSEKPFHRLTDLLIGQSLSGRQQRMAFCLLSRHHNGFVREAALCRIAAAPDVFVVPFVAQLASEYVYEILLQIGLRLPELDTKTYGAFFRDNPLDFNRLRQRMVSYWNCYYRWHDYASADGELRHHWRDRYVGFDIFDAFEAMARTDSFRLPDNSVPVKP